MNERFASYLLLVRAFALGGEDKIMREKKILRIVVEGSWPEYVEACRGKNALLFRTADTVRFIQRGSGILLCECSTQDEAEVVCVKAQ